MYYSEATLTDELGVLSCMSINIIVVFHVRTLRQIKVTISNRTRRDQACDIVHIQSPLPHAFQLRRWAWKTYKFVQIPQTEITSIRSTLECTKARNETVCRISLGFA
jgi:hypothetical protein